MTAPKQMHAAVLTGHGGLGRLEYRTDFPVPVAGPGEVLVRVGACGMNNTDINTRIGWYDPAVTTGTTVEAGTEGLRAASGEAATWSRSTVSFPHIQGADVVGSIAATGPGVAERRVGERVITDPWLRAPDDPDDRDRATYLGSERRGGFAQFVAVPSANAHAIESPLSDAELATFPCAYSTAENMLTRARVAAGETVLVTGASGGVGTGLVQLAKLRGATIIAVAGAGKLPLVRDLGADATIARGEGDLVAAVAKAAAGRTVDVVADVVGGADFPKHLAILRRGGRYVTAGAIAGPMVELDLRTLYLKDLELIGATMVLPGVFQALVSHIESGAVRPVLAKSFTLADIRVAQTAFLDKAHVGNLVLVPPA